MTQDGEPGTSAVGTAGETVLPATGVPPGAVRPFASLQELRSLHERLLERQDDNASADLVRPLRVFIARACATGTLLEAPAERRAAQSIVDYWATRLFRISVEVPVTGLEPFDEARAPALPDDRCPFVGLNAFDRPQHTLFFGRDRLIQQLLDHLRRKHLLILVGASGSGKSSVVRAGLIPALAGGALANSEDWLILPPLLPGSEPLRNLARLALGQLAVRPERVGDLERRRAQMLRRDPKHLAAMVAVISPQPTVLVVDQFEEVFTLCRDEGERRAFVLNLLHLVRPGSPHRLILTMRSNFVDNAAKIEELQSAFEGARVDVQALTKSELRAAIEEPAQWAGLKLDAEIVDELVGELVGEPSGLPLLQFTLLRLWQARRRNRVKFADYRQLGGGRLALARAADAFYAGLSLEEQKTVERILLRMTRPGDRFYDPGQGLNEGLEVTSNRILEQDLYLIGEDRGRIAAVLAKLAAAGLVRRTPGPTAADAQVEVAHEALVRNWPTLNEWLDRDREAQRERLRFADTARRWEAGGLSDDLLLRGEEFQRASTILDLSELERAFLERSHAADAAERKREDELERQRIRTQEQARANRSLRRLAVVLGAACVVATVASVAAVGLYLQTISQRSALLSQAEELNRQANDLGTAVVVANTAATAAVANERTAGTAAALAATNAQIANTAATAAVANERTAGTAAALAATNEQIANMAATAAVAAQQTAVAGDQLRQDIAAQAEAVQQNANATNAALNLSVSILEERSRQQETVISVLSSQVGQEQRATIAATATVGATNQQSLAERLARQSREAAAPRDALDLALQAARISDSMVVEDALQLAIQRADRNVITFTEPVVSATWGRSREAGSYLLLVSGSLVHVYNSPDRTRALQPLRHERPVRSAAWASNSERVVTTDEAGIVRIWDVSAVGNPDARPRVIDNFSILPGPGTGAAWSPDDRRIVAASAGGVRVWDVEARRDLLELNSDFGNAAFSRAAWSPDGAFFISAGNPGLIWDSVTGQQLPSALANLNSAAWSPGGGQVVTASTGNTATIWSYNSRRLTSTAMLRGHSGVLTDCMWSPSGRSVVTASTDGTARVWQSSDGELLSTLEGTTGTVFAATWSPDGSAIVTGGEDGTARIYLTDFSAIVRYAEQLLAQL